MHHLKNFLVGACRRTSLTRRGANDTSRKRNVYITPQYDPPPPQCFNMDLRPCY